MAENQAFVTLATNEGYLKGALVLAQSLKNTGTKRKVVLLAGFSLPEPWSIAAKKTFDEIIDVSIIDSHDSTRLALMSRPELGVTFTKLQCWTLTHYNKCVFMDADTLVIENIDALFEREEISAAPDVGWPDLFNTGVFVFQPNMETYHKLLQYAKDHGSFDGGDQGLLNGYFSDWATKDIRNRLPFVYNMAANLTYTYLPALLRFGTDVKVVHFLGQSKPWTFGYDEKNDYVYGGNQQDPMTTTSRPFIRSWWQMWNNKVAPLFSESKAASNEAPAQVPAYVHEQQAAPSASSSNGSSAEPRPVKASSPGQWDRGQVDYTGDDRFANIQKHLDSIIKDSGY